MTLRWDLNEYSCSDIFNSCIKDSLIVIWTVNRKFITNQPTLALMSQKSKFCFTCSNVSSQFFLGSKHLIESDGFIFASPLKSAWSAMTRKDMFSARALMASNHVQLSKGISGKKLTDTFVATSNTRDFTKFQVHLTMKVS